MRIKDSMDIEDAAAGTSATVKKALVSLLRDRLSVSVAGGPDIDVQGNLLDHEYEISQGGTKVAEVSKKWFRVRDTPTGGGHPGPERRPDPGHHRVGRPDGRRLTG